MKTARINRIFLAASNGTHRGTKRLTGPSSTCGKTISAACASHQRVGPMVDQIRVDVRPSAGVCWLINTIKLGICVCQCVCVCVQPVIKRKGHGSNKNKTRRKTYLNIKIMMRRRGAERVSIIVGTLQSTKNKCTKN